jgi:hypothetical protein
MKSVIFLDNDGVMCLSTEWGSRDKKINKWKLANPGNPGYVNDPKIPAHIKMDNFNSKAVKVLNDILALTDAEIVVSSDWKLHCTLEGLQDMFIKYGVSKAPIGTTPNHVLKSMDEIESMRVAEISEWLESHPDVEKWVAIDDLDLSTLEFFVHTKRMKEGIKQSGIKEQILKILSE